MTSDSRTPLLSIFIILVLYLLQGLSLGIITSMPIFLTTRGATWSDQTTFNFVFYPFSFKLVWAPLIDAIYSTRFGRRKSWLVPIQLSLAGIFTLLSFYVESFISTGRIALLTVIFFIIVFLVASQDICVDGLAITLFADTNPQWASTSQHIGQTVGRFLGFSFLLIFESATFTNKYIRTPLSLPHQNSGLFSFENFIRLTAIGFFIVTMSIAIFFREKKEEPIIEGEEVTRLSLRETYISMWKLLKKSCIRQLILISLLIPIGLIAAQIMTRVTLITEGVSQANLALVNIPVSLLSLIAPVLIRDTEKPLLWVIRSYILCLITSIPLAAYVYFTPRMIMSNYYYPLLIVVLACSEFSVVLRTAAQVGFYASISEPRIGGTYMTFLVTLGNLGSALNSSFILYIASWLPQQYAYVGAIGICTVLGSIWLVCSLRMIRRLQNLPICEWYLMPEKNVEKDHEMSLIENKERD